MKETIELVTPLDSKTMRQLHVRDIVTISGTVYTARDMAHLRLRGMAEKGEALPEHFAGGVIFHAGPVVKKTDHGYTIWTIGPTTSIRMEPHSYFVGDIGVKAIVGKGGMGDDSVKVFARYGMVYLLAAPGCGVLHAEAIREVKAVHWLEELGVPEAIWVLEVQQWGPLMVAMDSHGQSIFHSIRAQGMQKLDKLVAKR